MLDFDGDVVSDRGMLRMERLADRNRMRWPVEKIGIAERDVFGTGCHLPADVFQNHAAIHHAKCAVIYGNDGAVPAQMPASAAGFRIANDSFLAAGEHP